MNLKKQNKTKQHLTWRESGHLFFVLHVSFVCLFFYKIKYTITNPPLLALSLSQRNFSVPLRGYAQVFWCFGAACVWATCISCVLLSVYFHHLDFYAGIVKKLILLAFWSWGFCWFRSGLISVVVISPTPLSASPISPWAGQENTMRHRWQTSSFSYWAKMKGVLTTLL